MKTAKIALSFDDGRIDNIEVIYRYLIPKGIPCTLFVATAYVDGSCSPEKAPTRRPAMSIENVVALAKEPLVELGLHGDNHSNERSDIEMGRQKMLKWLSYPSSYRFGFASPGTAYPVDKFVDSNDPLFTRDILYLAMGMRISSLKKLRVFARKAGRVLAFRSLFAFAYRETIMDSCSDRVIYRVPIHARTSFEQVKAIIDIAVRRKEAVTLMFHSIDDKKDDTWTWDKRRFCKLIAYLLQLRNQQKIEMLTVRDLHQAIR